MTTQSASFAADAADIFARASTAPTAGPGTVGNDHLGENALLNGGGQACQATGHTVTSWEELKRN